MKIIVDLHQRSYHIFAFILLLVSAWAPKGHTQGLDIEKSIEKHRKGIITVKSGPDSNVIIEQLGHEFWFGCAIGDAIFDGRASDSDVKQYKEKFLKNFNSAVTENAVKWGNMERQKGKVNYAVVDAMLKWTDESGIPLRAHNLFWGIPKFVQPWVKELSDEELERTLKTRAETVSARYKGRFTEYDLNNEMIHGNYYEERLGPDITRKMAEWAQNGDPDIKLYLNDYDILTGNMLGKFMTHIRDIQAQNIPIAGIGVQGHLHSDTFDRDELIRSLDSLAKFGLPVKITEFNMPGQRSSYHIKKIRTMTPEEEEKRAKELVDYYRICFAHPAVEGILMWGFWEGANWIPVSSLYKRDWTPTPAAEAYQDLIFNEWWTRAEGKSDQNGSYTTSAFYGKYKITVDGVSKEVNLMKADGSVVVEF
jgi:GH35 family endo-1,4-beta-xylanase